MIKYKEFNIPLYRGLLIVCFSDDAQECVEEFGNKYNYEQYAHTWHIDRNGMDAILLLFNPNPKHKPITHGVIAHEAVHGCSFLFEIRGALKDIANDEPEAYLVEWMVDRVYESLKEFKLLNKIK